MVDHRLVFAGAGLTAGAFFGAGADAHAAAFEVDRTDDATVATCASFAPNDCTLRGAVAASNASAATNDQITFFSSLTGQVTLGSELLITDAVYMSGPGPTISGNNATRLFDVDLATPGEFVGFDRLRLTEGNTLLGGGAINNVDGNVKVVDSVLTGNHASGNGGAINAFSGASTQTEIYGSTISGNSADQAGGGVSTDDSVTIEASTIAGNTTTTGSGGGVYFGFTGVVRDTTISGNNSPLGGGLYVDMAGGIDAFNSVIANNTAATGPDAAGGSVDLDFSLLEAPAGSTVATLTPGSTLIGVDPQLGPLQDNGGTSPLHPFTLRPAPTSPVVDKGNAQRTQDERRILRPFDVPALANSTATGADGGDMGAVELTLAEATVAAGGGGGAPPPKGAGAKKCKKAKKGAAAGGKKKGCKKKKRK